MINTSDLSASFPRLNPGEVVLPYINANGEIARVDAHRLVNERERKLSGEPRLVEDSVLALEKLKKVGLTLLALFQPMRKIFPINPRADTSVPFWVPLCTTESTFHT